MSETSRRIVYDLLQFRRVSAIATDAFLTMKHDADLCPKFQARIESVFSAFDKYQRITYDIQGPGDAGTDIVLRERDTEEYEYISFQIKSQDDLKEKNYLKTLKAQLFDSRNRYQKQLTDYYIVLCCSLLKKDPKTGQLVFDKAAKGRIRSISGDFNLEPNVHVIEPEYALAFLRLSNLQIDAVVKNKLGEGDIVLREACDLVRDLTPTETALVAFMIWMKLYKSADWVNINDIKESTFLQSIYSSITDRNREAFFIFEEDLEDVDDRDYYALLQQPTGLNYDERIIQDLDYLEGERLELDDDTGKYSIELQTVQPLATIMMDGSIRYDYSGDELLLYVTNVVLDLDIYQNDSQFEN